MSQNNQLDWGLFKRLLPYLKDYYPLIGLSLFFMLTTSITSVAHPFLIKTGIDKNIALGDFAGLKNTALILLIVMTIALIFQVAFNYTVRYLGQRLLFDLRLDIFQHLIFLSNNYFDLTPVGDSLTHVTNDVEAIREFISEGVITVIGELLKIVFILAAMLVINYKLALLTFLTIPVFVAGTMIFRKSIRSGFRGVRKANAEINTSIVESITGIREIIQFNYKDKSKEIFSGANCNYLRAYLKVVNAYALYFPVLEVVSNAAMVLILYFAHKFIGVSLQMGEIFAFFFYINMFFRPLRQLAERFNMFQGAMAASERIFRFLDREPSIVNREDGKTVPCEFQGQIEFQKVNFSYTPDSPVLKDVSFILKPGEKVALVGHTGSGKTTIINLLNRLYDVDSGAIRIDGVDCRDYNLFDLRKNISTIPQDPFIFTGSIAENISLHDPGVERSEIMEAAGQSNAHEFIKGLPHKYDESVLEEGKRLSSGQKQLLSFARTFIRKVKIVILDEATSNIDSETEKLIEAATSRLFAGRTVIIIAHRLSTIQMVDRILVMHKGRIVEEGNHSELLQKEGVYSRLYHTQAFLQN